MMAPESPLIAVRDNDLASRIAYRNRYFDNPEGFFDRILAKTVVPYQVEVQPGRLRGRALCWMECPYCYGGSSENTGERLTPERYVDVLRQTAAGPHGGVHKIIFAGYATDPLNYEHIDDLVATSLAGNQIVGFHTKLLRVSDRFISLLASPSVPESSYVTVSVDAGSAETYNKVHNIDSTKDIYSRILENLRRLAASRRASNARFDVTANYLVTRVNATPQLVEKAIRDISDAGAQVVRFSFPQLPRGMDAEGDSIIPTRAEIQHFYATLKPVIDAHQGGATKVMILDVEGDLHIEERRTLPCFARYLYPTIAYDGYLSNCSQSAAPHFRGLALGNLATRDFWDAFYDYDTAHFGAFLERQHAKMNASDCRCDRKEHTVNLQLRDAAKQRFAI